MVMHISCCKNPLNASLLSSCFNFYIPNVIKVYVCHLRNGLEDHGLPADLIETGTRSYRLRAHAIPKIMELVTRP